MGEFVFESHVNEVFEELNKRVPVILQGVGLEAEGNAVSEITAMGAVDTGRLRNSITYATATTQGAANTQPVNKPDGVAKSSDYATHGTPEDDSVYIGTNVEYAQYIEKGQKGKPGRPFLQNAIANYQDDYISLIKKGLE